MSSKISDRQIKLIIERLKGNQNRKSTQANYLGIWRQFNKFINRLETRPKCWEDGASAYGAYLVEQGLQSATIRSYISALKHTLKTDGYPWQDDKVLLNVLVRASKIENDVVKVRLPIHFSLLEMLLFELNRKFKNSPFTRALYTALFCLAYYGLMRVGELALGDHTLKAKDVYIATNKNKILLVLYTSKTHGKESAPQQIKISESEITKSKKFFCPFKAARDYMSYRRREYYTDQEQFFVFADGSPVKPSHVRCMLRTLLKSINLDHRLYQTHCFRIGRSVDLLKYGVPLEVIKRIGRWKSNAVYKYLKFL